jgi:hypothetical protein
MDLNSNAFRIVQRLTAENKDDKRVRAASSAGKKGGSARAAVLTAQQRKNISVKANDARWRKRTGEQV